VSIGLILNVNFKIHVHLISTSTIPDSSEPGHCGRRLVTFWTHVVQIRRRIIVFVIRHQSWVAVHSVRW
jgi:hypothetical protein